MCSSSAPPASSAQWRSDRFPLFSCKEDYNIIMDTARHLERSGFYWGPLGVEEAHRMLRTSALGSFLIRDSRQRDVLFTLSYHSVSGPMSVRIEYKEKQFSLAGSKRSFSSIFVLLDHYISAPQNILGAPYMKQAQTQ
ncbi:suppressor of cytokine signalling 1 homolog [Red seabream iridovirus]|uniref:Suppressor of cytokine signaling protein n=3 Tax=Infectious spleen and kidney necrosis virus TaxID=180170 RepID=A0A3Q9EFZ9_ISKNV|nr:suppressor of cytokine signaling protein [Pompano iridovirus]QQA04092.1 suppressor of cytokine signaling protein [Large yellow croaker iridovirus]UNA01373.1 suppressor of cytokine signaling 1-like protein [Red seabream iridovirus]WDW26038.2 suppressor of cytokine signaling protein [Megalocytivirus FD201807]AZQ20956.1 suppressor of cytokine signaling protein [Pompano iridovirus]